MRPGTNRSPSSPTCERLEQQRTLIKTRQRGKMDAKAVKGILVGYGEGPLTIYKILVTAEYLSAAEAAMEVLYLRYLLEELGYTQEKATVLHENNRACMSMPTKDTMGKRSKHLEIATRLLQDLVQANKVALQYCNTRENAADILTKPIPRDQFSYLRELVGIAGAGRSETQSSVPTSRGGSAKEQGRSSD